jgi:sulfate transport system ATP-binding protein
MTSIAIRDINKQFGDFQALSNINLDIGHGELVALLGPSGCGKTTLLRIIAGLENPDSGAILFSGQDTTHVHVRERQVGFVFQHYALFRHMTVFENIAFGLRVKPKNERLSEAQIQRKVHDLLHLVQLNTLANRFPAQLSGGQRQRVALARALAVDPKVLLLDEPFGALDAKVRKELRRWLRRLHDELHIATIFVTHDQEEALEVADRVVVMNKGNIEQVGRPNEVWEEPASPFVYEFLGDVNTFHGRLNAGEMQINLNGQIMTIAAPDHSAALNTDAIAYVRPHDCDIQRSVYNTSGVEAKLSRIINIGPITRLEFLIPKGQGAAEEKIVEVQIPATLQRENRYVVGETLFIVPQKVRIFA